MTQDIRYTRNVGSKFHPDGSFRRYPGATVICPFDESSPISEAMDWSARRLREMKCSGKLAVLPRSSYHMTAIELINDQQRKPERWSSLFPTDVTMKEADTFFSKAWREISKPDGFRMRYRGMGRGWTVYAHDLEPFDAREAKRLATFRDEVAEKTGVRKKDHDTYTFHMTLAYLLVELEPAEVDEINRASDEIDEYWRRNLPEFTVPAPKLTFYHDMSRFTERIDRDA
jgi:hypothetical protein